MRIEMDSAMKLLDRLTTQRLLSIVAILLYVGRGRPRPGRHLGL